MDVDSARMLLDPAAMQPLWSELPALQRRTLRGAEFDTLWVKPGRHFNVCYRLSFAEDGARPLLASACVVALSRALQLARDIGPHRTGDPLNCPHCRTCQVRPTVLLQLFPFDHRLPTLPACCETPRIAHALETPLTDCEPRGYRPGMRCQIRYRTANGTHLYGKVAVETLPGQGFHRHQQVHALLAGVAARVHVPQPLRYLADLQLAVVAGAAGESLFAALRAGRDLNDTVSRTAEALAQFHRLRVDGIERIYGVQDEVDLLSAWVALVAALYPQLAEDLRAGLADLASAAPEPGPTRAFVHRDFYDKQVLVGYGGVTFLDMDTAGLGEAEIDLGNFCAHLRLRGMQWNVRSTCDALETAFVRAYPLPVDAARIDWYRRATLLRLACGYALRPHWHHLAPQLAAEALS